MVTPNVTPAVKDDRIDADKARQAAAAALVETSANGQYLTETENYSGDKSNSELSNYEVNSDGDVIPVLPEDRIDNITGTDEIL